MTMGTMDLLLAKLIVTLRADAEIADPYTLFSLKNEFTQSFRQAVCHADGRCESCLSRQECSYHTTFARELAADPAALKRHQKPSLPFVFQPPVLPLPCAKGSHVELCLVLFGSATHYLAEYWEALQHLFRHDASGSSGRFSLVKLEAAGCSGFRTELAAAAGPLKSDLLTTISYDDLAALNTLDPQQIPLRFETHLRIARDGSFLRDFSFSPFIRSLLRRLSSLAYYYGCIMELDFKRLSAQSEAIKITENCFHWEEWQKGRQYGIVGSGVLSGELSDFHPALLLGEYLNCGKDATFGLGRYVLAR
ncbi:MAG: CRISPR system precrRNA processing endoribonuclease RAMP protein Cas6 [Geobacteraceae bacterium]